MKKKHYSVLAAITLLVAVLATGCGSAPQAETGDTVRVHYTGTLQDGTVFDSSVGSEPLGFTIGQGQLIPGFEQAVLGMQVGESRTVTIPVDQAYGPRRDDMVLVVERNQLPEDMEPQVGMELQMNRGDGGVVAVTVTEVSETTITVDANHPLAGQDLIFEIELVEIEPAPADAGSTASQESGLTSMPLPQALSNGQPTVAEFGRGTCIPCKQMKPILEELAREYEGRANLVIISVDESRDLASQYRIMAIPTQICFDSSGNEVTRHIGFWPKEAIIAQLEEMGTE